MDDSLFDIYQNIESAKALWGSLESKYMAEDASSKNHLRIEEGLRNQELDNNPNGKNQIGSSSVNMVEGDGAKNSKNNKNNKNKRKFNSGGDKSANKKSTLVCWKCNKPGHMKKDCRSPVVRLTEPKMKNLGEKGIDCIFIGYAENSKCYRFYVIEPNDYVSVNSIIESIDAILNEERFTSIPRPRGMIQPSSSKITEDEVEGADDVPGPSVPRKSTRTRKTTSFGSDFQLYLVEGTRDKTVSLREYCYIIEEDPRTLSEAMASRDVAFWKEAIQNVKIYMKQPEGFVMPGHENKVCKLKKSLYGLKQAPKQWHQKFDDVVLSNGFSLNQVDKYVYSRFDDFGNGVLICLYVDDMLIFGKSRHLGVRHSMIRELIKNGVISVEFIKTQLNLAVHLTKGLARDLVYKAAIGMGLKSESL
nr:zinc finger, CCHC-type [Tanacetum cinerariifolium]